MGRAQAQWPTHRFSEQVVHVARAVPHRRNQFELPRTMTAITTADDLSRAAVDVGILTELESQQVLAELGTHDITLAEFAQGLVRKNLVTNFQLERVMSGLRTGYFYGDYKVLYGVGAGTFARVFRAVNTKDGNVYAVKVLRSRHSGPGQEEVIESFKREGELGLKLRHANIVGIHEMFSKRGLHYLVMDFIEGRNLRDFFKVRGRFQPLEAAKMIEGVVAGLTFAAAQGITHRDLKMSNVLISSDGIAKLVDFGLAAIESEGSDATNRRTVEYTALERNTGVRKDDPRSDIYFAGCMLYQMLSGRNPMPEGRDRMQKFNRNTFTEIVPILTLAPDVPPILAKVVNKAIEFDPEKRYQTAADMLAELRLVIKRLESGITDTTNQQALISNEGYDDKGEPRKLMVVESNLKMQDLLRDLFKKHGYRVLVTGDPERARERFMSDPRSAEVVLFTTAHAGRTALETFNQFAIDAATRDVPAVLLFDERHHSWQVEAQTGPHRTTISMPLKQRELRQAIRDVLSRQAV